MRSGARQIQKMRAEDGGVLPQSGRAVPDRSTREPAPTAPLMRTDRIRLAQCSTLPLRADGRAPDFSGTGRGGISTRLDPVPKATGSNLAPLWKGSTCPAAPPGFAPRIPVARGRNRFG